MAAVAGRPRPAPYAPASGRPRADCGPTSITLNYVNYFSVFLGLIVSMRTMRVVFWPEGDR